MQNAIKAVSSLVHDGQLEIVVSTGMRSLWPVSSLQFVKRIDGVLTNFHSTKEDLLDVEVWPSGEGIEFPRIDQAFQVSALMQGEVGNAEWVRQVSVA